MEKGQAHEKMKVSRREEYKMGPKLVCRARPCHGSFAALAKVDEQRESIRCAQRLNAQDGMMDKRTKTFAQFRDNIGGCQSRLSIGCQRHNQ